jgi:hypothetical protein
MTQHALEGSADTAESNHTQHARRICKHLRRCHTGLVLPRYTVDHGQATIFATKCAAGEQKFEMEKYDVRRLRKDTERPRTRGERERRLFDG